MRSCAHHQVMIYWTPTSADAGATAIVPRSHLLEEGAPSANEFEHLKALSAVEPRPLGDAVPFSSRPCYV